MKKITKIIFNLLLSFIIIGIIHLNASLYYSPHFKKENDITINKDVYHQVQFLKKEIHKGAAKDMQSLFPEGFVFLNALYALSWKDLIAQTPESSAIYHEGIQEIDWAWKQIDSPKGKSIFSKNLPLEYGVFYQGWNNYTLGSKLAIQSPDKRVKTQVILFKEKCNQIATAISKTEFPYLESYRDNSWPADNFVALASLAMHDKIFQPKYSNVIRDWMTQVKKHLDPETSLIPHMVDTRGKTILEGARGSSQSLTLNFLLEINESFAKEQFKIYKTLFLDKRLGLYGIREYPKGTKGSGDIDSGPVIWGIGGSASIVGQRTLYRFESYNESKVIRNSVEAFGVSITWKSKKKYLFGQLAMADAFIAWSNSIEKASEKATSNNWRWKFQFISLLIILTCIYFFKRSYFNALLPARRKRL